MPSPNVTSPVIFAPPCIYIVHTDIYTCISIRKITAEQCRGKKETISINFCSVVTHVMPSLGLSESHITGRDSGVIWACC